MFVIGEINGILEGPSSSHDEFSLVAPVCVYVSTSTRLDTCSDVKGWRTSVKVRPPGFSLTFRTFCLIAALTGPTIFSEREAPSVLRKRVTYVLKDESDRSHLPANYKLAPKAEKGGKVRAWPCTRKVADFS